MKTKQQFYFPIDSWVYLKIYCGELSTDDILMKQVSDIIKKLKKKIDKWFFIKYRDPDKHIRLRFKMKNQNFTIELISLLKKELMPLVENDIIWKLQFDSYKLETKRYEYVDYHFTEELFCLDSKIFIENLKEIKDEEKRFFYNLKSSLDFIKLFYKDPKEIINFIKTSEGYYKKEFKAEKQLNQQLSQKYRVLKSDIEKLLNEKESENNWCKQLNEKKLKISKIIEGFTIITPNSKYKYVSSHIHLNTNRCFVSNQRLYEMITYDFLYRYYNSYMKINKL